MAKSSRKTAVLAAVLGAGAAWESRYRPALELLQPRLKVRMVHDPVYNRAVAVAADMGAEVAPSISAVLERPEVDAVLLLDHVWYGPAILEMILRAAKPVFVAGDIGHDLVRLERLCRMAGQQGLTAMVEFSRRHQPSSYRLKELIATRLGPVQRLTISRRFADGLAAPGQITSLSQHGTLSIDAHWRAHLIGLFDYCVWIAGRRPEQLTASPLETIPAGASKPELGQRTKLLFRGGTDRGQPAIEADFELTFASSPGSPAESAASPGTLPIHATSGSSVVGSDSTTETVLVECQNGIARVEGPMSLDWRLAAGSTGSGSNSGVDWTRESLVAERTDTVVMLDHFCRRLLGGLIPVADLSDAYRGISLATAWEDNVLHGVAVAKSFELPAADTSEAQRPT